MKIYYKMKMNVLAHHYFQMTMIIMMIVIIMIKSFCLVIKINHNKNYILSILEEFYVNNDAQRTTTAGGNYKNDAIVEDATNNDGDTRKIIAHCAEIVSLERNHMDIMKTTIMETIK